MSHPESSYFQFGHSIIFHSLYNILILPYYVTQYEETGELGTRLEIIAQFNLEKPEEEFHKTDPTNIINIEPDQRSKCKNKKILLKW